MMHAKTARALAALAVLAVAAAEARVKLIGFGWDLSSATPEQVLSRADAFRETGLDGVVLSIPCRDVQASNPKYRTLMNDAPWRKTEWQAAAGVLKRLTDKPWLRESFVIALLAPHVRLKWDDDAAWSRFEGNVAVLAWLAKEGGLRGIFIDHEDYTNAKQYTRLPSDGRPYKDMARLARKRGEQICSAIYREFPDATLVATWFFSLCSEYLVQGGDAVLNATQTEDLWPWFLNGFIDAMPLTGRFVDGCENAYMYKAKDCDFFRGSVQMKRDALALVAPEIRWKYRALASAGFGQYLDVYLPASDRKADSYTKKLRTPGVEPSVDFSANLAQAVRVADDYVWLFGERAAFVDWTGTGTVKFEGWLDVTRLKTWNEKIPGLNDILKYTKDPLGYVDAHFGAGTTAPNLVRNGACTSMDGYGTWIAEWLPAGRRDGTFGVDTTVGSGDSCSLCAETVRNGCFTCSVGGVREGEVYAFVAEALGRAPSVSLFWSKDGKGVFSIPEERGQVKPGDQSSWRRIRALVTVPGGVDALVVRLETKLERGEKIHYDNVGVYKVR